MPDKQKISVKRPRHHVRGIWAVTLILVLCALVATATWVFVLTNTSNSNTSSFLHLDSQKKAKEEQKKTKEAKKGLKEYTNLSALFLFDYPDTWALEEKSNTIYLSSDVDYPKNYLAGSMPEMKDTDIYIQIHFSNQPIDISREAPGVKPKIVDLTIGGVSASRVTYNDGTTLSEIIHNLKAGDFYFLIITDTKTANKDKIEAYNKMLSSFKFGKDIINTTNNK